MTEPGKQAAAIHVFPSTNHPDPMRFRQSSKFYVFGLVLLIGIALLRIVSTYHVFNHTLDEGSHIACGIQWIEKGVYTYDLIDTPIPRVSVSILPYMAGLRGFGKANYWEEGALILAAGGHYWRNLTLARIAVLPYFVLATVIVFLWSRRIYGYPTALLAAGIFTMMPVVLAHSAIATTDVIFTSLFLTAVYAFTLWLEAPGWRTAAAFGFAAGLSAASKFSTLVYLPGTIVFTLLLYFAATRSSAQAATQERDRRWGPRSVAGILRSAAVVVVCAILVVWSAYRFSHAPLNAFSSAPDRVTARVFGPAASVTKGVNFVTARVPLPAPEFYNGMRFLRDQNRLGRMSYLFGRVKDGGWWYFYMVSLGLKTPLAILLLALAGGVSLVSEWFRDRHGWQPYVPIVTAVTIMMATLASRINIGVRHVMPVFAFLSMLAAWGAVRLWNGFSGRIPSLAKRAAVVVLLAWFVVSSALAHPDYLSYFNELGGKNPANLLVISDLDWGQDLARLSTYLQQQQQQQQHASHLSIAYLNIFEPSSLGLPETTQLGCRETATGWVAIGERYARVYPKCVDWVTSQPVHAYVGKSLRVYYVPEAGNQAQ